jgi:hypothetical protein
MTTDDAPTNELVPLELLDEEPTGDDPPATSRWPYLDRPVTSAAPRRPSRSRWGSRNRPGSEVSERR